MTILTTVAVSEEAYRVFLRESWRLGMETPEKLMERILENYAEEKKSEPSDR